MRWQPTIAPRALGAIRGDGSPTRWACRCSFASLVHASSAPPAADLELTSCGRASVRPFSPSVRGTVQVEWRECVRARSTQGQRRSSCPVERVRRGAEIARSRGRGRGAPVRRIQCSGRTRSLLRLRPVLGGHASGCPGELRRCAVPAPDCCTRLARRREGTKGSGDASPFALPAPNPSSGRSQITGESR